MGKQRALKNKDVVPAVKIDAARPKKHKKFDDSDDNQSEHEEFYPISAPTSQSAIEDDDNAPEEVVQDEIQIRALKEEVENLFAVQIGAKRKRKFTREAVVQKEVEEDSDMEYLDEKDLKVVSSSRREAKDLSAVDTSNSSDSENEDSGRDKMGLKRKIGNLEVAVISNASIDDFRLNSDAEQFLNQHRAKVQRTRYTSFMSQRRPAPAKKFSSKRKGK